VHNAKNRSKIQHLN